MGIWRPIYLFGGDAPYVIDEIIWKTDLIENEWTVEVTLIFGNLDVQDVGMTGQMIVTIQDIGTYTQCKETIVSLIVTDILWNMNKYNLKTNFDC